MVVAQDRESELLAAPSPAPTWADPAGHDRNATTVMRNSSVLLLLPLLCTLLSPCPSEKWLVAEDRAPPARTSISLPACQHKEAAAAEAMTPHYGSLMQSAQ